MKAKWPLAAVLIFCLGWLAHVAYVSLTDTEGGKTVQVRENSSKHRFINPLLYVDNSEEVFEYLNPLKSEVETYLDSRISSGRVGRASFYFRDLNSGDWTGVRPDDLYVPSSMLKVATLMAYLKIAESKPSIMQESLYYQKDPNDRQNYPPAKELSDGYYSVGQLLGQSLTESDNAANAALAKAQSAEIIRLFDALRIPQSNANLDNFMSPRHVSTIFRSLYSSSYLLDTYSEQALEFLTHTTFDKGVVAGVEPGVSVAHKFGEHTIYYVRPERDPLYQLHDCGIVYFPGRPYFICVMTEGGNLRELEAVLSEVSKKTYTFVKEKLAGS